MIQLTGKTYEWKSQLKKAGFTWNATSKTWDREEAIDTSADANFFEHRQIQLGIESGELRYANAAPKFEDANDRTHYELYGQYNHLAR